FLEKACRVTGNDMKVNAFVFSRQPVDARRYDGNRDRLSRTNAYFPHCRVGKEVDVLNALAQVIKDRVRFLSARPKGVGVIPRRPRSTSRTPSACSNSAIALETAGWDMLRRLAALPILPV